MSTHDLILTELRATAPPAPDRLRERVRAIAAAPASDPSLRRRFGGKGAALVLVPACLVVLVAGVFVGGRGGSKTAVMAPSHAASGGGGALDHPAVPAPADRGGEWGTSTNALETFGRTALTSPQRALPAAKATAGKAFDAATLPPANGRLQHYDVSLRLRVKDQDALAKATNDAMRLTRRFGGFVAGVDYSSAEGSRGDAVLTVRVPIAKIDHAIARFSKLGKIAAQHVSIQDLQTTVNVQNRTILELRKTIATAEEKLAGGNLSAAERIELQHRLGVAQNRLKALVAERGGVIREGRLTTVSLAFTTAKRHSGGAVHRPGRIGRAAHDAVGLLAVLGAGAVYLGIVLSPLVALALLVFLTRRTVRRREETRLLAQA